MKSQTEQILDYMKAGNKITPLKALKLFSCMRLGGRCWDLKKLGYPIKTEIIKTEYGKHVAQYSLQMQPKQLTIF